MTTTQHDRPDRATSGTALAAPSDSLKAKSIAQQFFKEFQALESEITQSSQLAREIESRGLLKRLTTSTSKDMTAIAKIQSNINRRMVDLVQETIRLNMLSYAGLVFLMEEIRSSIEHGFRDTNGHVTRLGDEGRALAEAATDIISGILDASRSTQDRIDHNAESIQHVTRRLDDEASRGSLRDTLLAELTRRADGKDTLDSRQDEALLHLQTQLGEKHAHDAARDATLDDHHSMLASQRQAIEAIEAMFETRQSATDARLDALAMTHARWRFTLKVSLTFGAIWLSALTWQILAR